MPCFDLVVLQSRLLATNEASGIALICDWLVFQIFVLAALEFCRQLAEGYWDDEWYYPILVGMLYMALVIFAIVVLALFIVRTTDRG